MAEDLSPVLRRDSESIKNRFATLAVFDDVADLFEIPPNYLRRILYVRREPEQYRHFGIPKRSGESRSIDAPPAALGILQRKLNDVLQVVYRRKRSVHGFITGRSIVSNALEHVGKRWILNVDLKDFFPSINFGRVRGIFMAPPYRIGSRAATVLAQIAVSDNKLPQGAPSSPMIANLVCSRFDGDLEALARRHRLTYTRYCDDLTFSSRAFTFPPAMAVLAGTAVGDGVVVGEELMAAIRNNGFELNREKSRLQFKDCHQDVTGITVNLFANVRRSLVREIRGMTHALERYGIEDAATEFINRYAHKTYEGLSPTEAFKHVLRGKLSFVGQVRGFNDPIYVGLRNHIHRVDQAIISPAISISPAPAGSLPRDDRYFRWSRLFDRVKQSVRQLEIVLPDSSIASGTAFAFSRGRLCTAQHNLVGATRLIDGVATNVISEAYLHARLSDIDCALLTHTHSMRPLPISATVPEPGEPLAAIGFATAPRRQPACGLYIGAMEAASSDYPGRVNYYQTSIAAAGGLSGSPVINSRGEVVGLVAESLFEMVAEGLPNRQFCSLVPISYALEIGRNGVLVEVPLSR